MACVPAKFRGEQTPTCAYDKPQCWEAPEDANEAALLHHVLTKQMHVCKDAGAKGCRADGHCKYGFPWPSHHSSEPALDPNGTRHNYYRPGQAHRNVVPYIPAVALAWGAHVNVQKVTKSTWSFYVLKYTLKVHGIAVSDCSYCHWTRACFVG